MFVDKTLNNIEMSDCNETRLNRCKCSSNSFLEEKFSDLIVINRGKEYHVHKIVLCSFIPYFNKMLSSGMKESTVNKLQLDHPAEAFDIIMDWTYNRIICITKENAVQLFHLADLMCITDLIDESLTFLFNNYSNDVMFDFEYLLKKISNDQVISTIDKYIRLNFKDIIATSEFLSFDFETINFIINHHGLNIDCESEILEAICNWISFNVETRIVHLSEFFKKIHWSEINKIQFINLLQANPWIQKRDELNPIVMSILEMILYNSKDKASAYNLKIEPRLKSLSVPSLCFLSESLDTEYKIRAFNILNGEEKMCEKLRSDVHLAEAKFNDGYPNGYIVGSGKVMIIDWTKKTYFLKQNKDSIYSLLFGRVFEFKNDKGGDVGFWKGNLSVELAPIPDGVDFVPCVIPYKAGFLLCGYSSDSQHMRIYKLDPQENIWTPLPKTQPLRKFRVFKAVVHHNLLILFQGALCYHIYNLESNLWSHSNNFSDNLWPFDYVDVYPFVYQSKLFLVAPSESSSLYISSWAPPDAKSYVVSELTLPCGKLEKICEISVEPRSDTLMFFMPSNECMANE